jgi:endonuclease/exonuclease/phosphatase family metal-dependent hydrolase
MSSKHFVQCLFVAVLLQLAACSPQRSPSAGEANGKAVSLKVMSYNIHHANPPSKPGLIDLAAIAQVIKTNQPDLVAIQEVDVHTKRSGDTLNQAKALGALTGMHYFFGKAINYDGGEYGVAILSKFPLRDVTVHQLPSDTSTHGEPRILLVAAVSLPGGRTVYFGNTHMDAQRSAVNRELQIKKILDITAGIKEPMIIAGDFNATPESSVIQQLDQRFRRTCNPCGFTIPNVNPNKTIDFIAYTPATRFTVVKHEVIAEPYASDHLPVMAELKY